MAFAVRISPATACEGTTGPRFDRRRRASARRRSGTTVSDVVSLEDAGRLAMELPQVSEVERHGNRSWAVAGKVFAWERPFSKADIKRFGDTTPPAGTILAISVDDLGEKEAVLAAQPDAFFTIPHFDGYAAVLIELRKVGKRALREALVDGWLACAPASLADEFLRSRSRRG
jgi:hypothetical protein